MKNEDQYILRNKSTKPEEKDKELKKYFMQLPSALSKMTSIQDVNSYVLQTVSNLFNAEGSVLRIYDPINNELVINEIYNLNKQDINKKYLKVPPEQCPCSQSTESIMPVQIESLSELRSCFSRDFIGSTKNINDYCIWHIPLFIRTNVYIGTICLITKIANNITAGFASDIQNFIMTYMYFLENTLVMQATQKTLQNSKNINVIYRKDYLNEVSKSISEVMSAESCSIFLTDKLDSKQLRLAGSTIKDWEKLDSEKVTYVLSEKECWNHLTSLVAVENRPVLCNDTGYWQQKKTKGKIERYQNHNVQSFIGAPISDKNGKVKGVIRCNNKLTKNENEYFNNSFSTYDIGILKRLTSICEFFSAVYDSYDDIYNLLTFVSHESNAPLHYFQGAIRELRHELKHNQLEKKRMINLIENLDGTSKLLNVLNTNWTIPLGMHSIPSIYACNLYGDVIAVVVGMLRPTCNYHGITIEYDGIKTFPTPIFVDPLALQQVFYNLLINSIKYINSDRSPIKIISKSWANKVSVYVFNYGIGVPEGEEELIFEYKYRASNTKDVNQRGQGLGLYVCRKILSSYTASIYVEKRQEPTVFAIDFPKKLFDQHWYKHNMN